MNITRKERLALGVCAICGKGELVNKYECVACRDKRNAKNREKWNLGGREQFHAKRQARIKKGVCTKCGKNKAIVPHRECEKCLEKYLAKYQKWKDLAYSGYGGYCCSCCGETIREFLTLDHVNNDGANHRREYKKTNDSISGFRGKYLYQWIVKNNFPPIFQVLCYNCNCGKQHNGGICPHKANAQIT